MSSILALVNIEVFRPNVEILLLAFREIKTMSIDLLSVIACAANRRLLWSGRLRILIIFGGAKEVKVLWVHEYSRPPIAQLAIITNADDSVGILVSDD